MNKKIFVRILLCATLVLSVICMSACGDNDKGNDNTSSVSTGDPSGAVTGDASDGTGDGTSDDSTEVGGDSSSSDSSSADSSSADSSSDSSSSDTSKNDPPETKPEEDEHKPLDPDKLNAVQQSAYNWCQSAQSAAMKNETLAAGSDTQSINKSWSTVYFVLSSEMTRCYNDFLDGDMTYDNLECFMKSCANVASAKGLANGYITLAKTKRVDVEQYAEAKACVEAGKYMKATKALARIDKTDFTAVANAKALVGANLENIKSGITEAVTEFMVRYDIADGKNYLEGLRGLGVDSHVDKEAARLEDYRKFQEEGLVKVNMLETLENIYTHCLIAFPEINFASKSSYSACGPDCLTPYEFKYLLQSLYDRGYIIIDANIAYNEEKDAPNYTIMLPEGKKPLILTFDDVTYDSRKMGKGMVDKLIVDEDGYICTYTKHKDGTEVVSYDNELFPIINAFVREHPDFTFRGARGTLFFTGFDGICGYRTQSEPVDAKEAALKLDRQNEIAQAKVVIEALREEGWTFGSHGYNHSNMPKISAASFRKEIDMWREEVGAIVGDTQLFCWPYGAHTNGDVNLRKNAQHKYLFDSGFTFFFGCGSARYFANELDGYGIFSDRKGVTGNVLLYIEAGYRGYVRDYPYLFDTEEIWDPLRRPYKEWLLGRL